MERNVLWIQSIVLVTASLTVLSTSSMLNTAESNEQSESDSVEDINTTDEKNWDDNGPIPFDLKGSLRRSLVYDAALADPIRNVISSPISALLPLGKLVIGTDRGECRDEILNALGYQKNKIKTRLRSIVSKLKVLPGVTLSIASFIYMSDKKQLEPTYHRDTMSVFKSTVQKLDFGVPAEAAAVINRKVFDGTRGKIPEIISHRDISPDTSLMLVNAIYFSGRWKDPFREVSVEKFYSPVGRTNVSMMSREGNYYYYSSEILGAQLLEIPFIGDAASLVILLPMVKNGLTLLLRQLKVAPDLLNQAVSKMREYRVTVSIPKFKVQSELDLQRLYEKSGVIRIFFEEQSNLSRISRDNDTLWVTTAKQKAYIELTEGGAYAPAAPDATDEEAPSPSPANEAVFKADRPFLYFVKMEGDQLLAGIFTNI